MISSYHLSGTMLGINGCQFKQNSPCLQGIDNLYIQAKSELKSVINTIALWKYIEGVPN